MDFFTGKIREQGSNFRHELAMRGCWRLSLQKEFFFEFYKR